MTKQHPLPGTDHVVAGIRLHVVTYGNGSGLPLLFLHGRDASSHLWSEVQRALGHRHVSHAPDLLGLGASEAPVAGRYDLASQAELMLRLLDSLQLPRVGLVAHDAGGGVAAHLTALAPDRVAALVLTGTPLHADAWPTGSLTELVAPLISRVTGLFDPLAEVERAAAARRFGRAVDPAAVESAYSIVRAQPPPTLVVWGNDDTRLSAAYGRRVAADLGATFVAVMDAGHDLPLTRPERLAEETEAWLADLPAHLTADVSGEVS
ncbi:MAG: alpha/beta fold hydrolase [Actinomycetota bacterium]